jgi:hypothetical protein
MIKAYDKILIIENSNLLKKIMNRNKALKDLNHYMIYFDDGPCFEFICNGVSCNVEENAVR